MAEDQVEFNCPHCDQLYKLTVAQLQRYAGRTTNCRKCQQPFQFPSVAEPEPEEQAVVEEHVVEQSVEHEEAADEAPAYTPPSHYAPAPRHSPPPAPRQTLQYRRPPAARQAEPFSVGAFLGFRYLAAPTLVHVVFWFGTIAFVYAGTMSIVRAVQLSNAFSSGELLIWGLMAGLGQIVVGPVMLRIFCEVVLVLFRILDSLRDMKDAVDERLPRP